MLRHSWKKIQFCIRDPKIQDRGSMTFGRLGWKKNFQATLNGTPERRWREKFITSFNRGFWGQNASPNAEVWFGLDHYILIHPSRFFQSGKPGGISSQNYFYKGDPIWQNKVWNLLRVFWGIKQHFLGVNTCFFSTTPSFPILHTNTFPTTQESHQSKFICEIYSSQKLTFLVSPP